MHASWLASRPPSMENNAIKLLIRALEEDATQAKPGFRIHIAHLADSGSMADIETAKKKGARTCLVLFCLFQTCNLCINPNSNNAHRRSPLLFVSFESPHRDHLEAGAIIVPIHCAAPAY